MFGLFDWVRKSARSAFLAGIQDAVNDLQQAEGEAPAAIPLRLTFTPETKDETPPTKRRKAE